MHTEITRREFVGRFLPSTAHIRTLGGYRHLALRVAKWSVLAACVWFAWQIFSGVTLDGWRSLGWAVLKFVIPAVILIWLVSRVQQLIDESGNAFLQGVARGIGRVVVLVATLSAGAVFYHLWQRKPVDAVMGLLAVALMEFSRGVREKPARKSAEAESSETLT